MENGVGAPRTRVEANREHAMAVKRNYISNPRISEYLLTVLVGYSKHFLNLHLI